MYRFRWDERSRRPFTHASVAGPTFHHSPFTVNVTIYTLHPTPYTPHPAPCILHPTTYNLHPTPYTRLARKILVSVGRKGGRRWVRIRF